MNSHFPTPPRHTRSSSNNFTPPLLQHSFNPSNSSDQHSNHNQIHNHIHNHNHSNSNGLNNSQGSSSVLDWAAWTDESPELTRRISNGINNPDSDISMDGNTFMDPFAHNMSHSNDYSTLGMDVDTDRSMNRLMMDNEADLERGKNDSSSKRVRTRLQSRTTMSPVSHQSLYDLS